MVGGEHSLTILASQLFWFVWDRQCLEDSEQKDHLINESITNVLIEQPGLYLVCSIIS